MKFHPAQYVSTHQEQVSVFRVHRHDNDFGSDGY